MIYRFNVISIKIPEEHFCRYRQADSKVYGKAKELEKPKLFWGKKKNKVRRITLINIKMLQNYNNRDSIDIGEGIDTKIMG